MSARPAIEVSASPDARALWLTFARPKANILDEEMLVALRDALVGHRDDRHLRCVFLRGDGGQFSFGASVEEHRRESVARMLSTFHATIRVIGNYPVPVVSVVEGRCLGGGFEVALASHVVLAKEGAVFACPEIRLGVLPPVLSVLGPSRLGASVAERMLITGEELSARRLEACGFVAELIEGQDAVAFASAWYEKTLARLSAYSLREAVAAARRGSGFYEMLRGPLDAAERQYLERIVTSRDGNAGIEAFIAKQVPVWEDA